VGCYETGLEVSLREDA